MVNARNTLMAGFTTVRDVGGDTQVVVALKNAIKGGVVPGPRMWVAGSALSPTGGHGDSHSGLDPRLTQALGGEVQIFAKRLQVQERMTNQIAATLMRKLSPLGVGVVIEARHLCMEMRGAESLLSPTVTSSMLGVFRKDARTRQEFLKLIRIHA